MALKGAASSESRASKILHGLGFTPAMQARRSRPRACGGVLCAWVGV
jgi:hypothetical protein